MANIGQNDYLGSASRHGDPWLLTGLGAKLLLLVLVALVSMPGFAWAQDISWPDAVARLAAERTRAETCVRLLKQYGSKDAAALSRGEIAYSDAKAEVDAVIAGLTVVLAQGKSPPTMADLEARLTRGVQGRETFCREAMTLVPNSEGTKSAILDLLGDVVKPLIEAAMKIYEDGREDDELLRDTIQTQLEATKWSDFASIKS
jgi:hypothetical protein